VNRLEQAARGVVEQFRQRRPLRAGSFVVSFFGDVVVPRGGSVWLGELIRAMEPLGVSGRLVRTSVFRLVQDGWFEASKLGRKSFYLVTGEGSRRFRLASDRIYGRPGDDWDGQWLLALLPAAPSQSRDRARQELNWMGFGVITPGLMGRPVGRQSPLEESLSELPGSPVVFRSSLLEGVSRARLDELIRSAWKLEETEQGYQRFLGLFEPLLDSARGQSSLSGRQCLLLRVLLIHEYRRILLRDPQLPAALLPVDWHGTRAYELCRELYRILLAPSEAEVSGSMVGPDGPMPPPDSGFLRRFGGLTMDSEPPPL
jgi:phenylacetic acid degradation operon negative regulatory protein